MDLGQNDLDVVAHLKALAGDLLGGEEGGIARAEVKDGVARTAGGNLAGSTSMLIDCVRCAIKFGIPEYEAVKMATLNPARLMGLDKKGRIEVGCDADFIIVDNDFNLIKSIARGEF